MEEGRAKLLPSETEHVIRVATKPNPKYLEYRIHCCLKRSWQYVDKPMISDSAKNEVAAAINAPASPGVRSQLIFALQTAWPFIHGSGDLVLIDEATTLMRHDFSLTVGNENTPKPTRRSVRP